MSIDYTDLDLIEDNMFLVGDTENRRDWSEDGPQYECYDLSILLHNIAVAGALCEAYRQHWYTWNLACPHWAPGCQRPWSRL
jgi:hypothetical protein